MLLKQSANIVATCFVLNVADEQSTTRTLSLNAFFDYGIVHFVVFFAMASSSTTHAAAAFTTSAKPSGTVVG